MNHQVAIAIIVSLGVVLVVACLAFGRTVFRRIAINFGWGAGVSAESAERPKAMIEGSVAHGGDAKARNEVGGDAIVRNSEAMGSVEALTRASRSDDAPK